MLTNMKLVLSILLGAFLLVGCSAEEEVCETADTAVECEEITTTTTGITTTGTATTGTTTGTTTTGGK